MLNLKNQMELKKWLVCKFDVQTDIFFIIPHLFLYQPQIFSLLQLSNLHMVLKLNYPSTLMISPSGNLGAIISNAEIN